MPESQKLITCLKIEFMRKSIEITIKTIKNNSPSIDKSGFQIDRSQMTQIENQTSIFTNEPDASVSKYKEPLEKIQLQLSSYGLSANQCKVYIFLGKYGSSTAPNISKVLKLPRTETYKLLTTLQNKGIVSASFQHPIQFLAIPLTDAVHSLINTEKERIKKLEHQKLELNQLWNNIPEFHTKIVKNEEEKFQIIQGQNQISSKIHDMITSSEKKLQIIGNENDFIKFYQTDVLEQMEKSSTEYRILTNSSDKTLYMFDGMNKTNIQKLPSSINENLCFIIKDNNEVLFYMKNCESEKENNAALWTTSTSMIYSKKLLFSSLWSKSKNID